MLTSKRKFSKLSGTFEKSLFDHHKLISIILKSGGFNGKPKKEISHTDTLTQKILTTLWNFESVI